MKSSSLSIAILFGVLAFVSGLAIAMPLALSTGNPILPGIIMPIIINVFFVNAVLFSDRFGTATIAALIYGILSLPFSVLGPPFFIPKIAVIALPTLFLDISITLRRTTFGCVIGGFIGAFPVNLLMVMFLNLFGMGEIPGMSELLLPIQIVLSAEGLLGGYLGWKIHHRLKRLK